MSKKGMVGDESAEEKFNREATAAAAALKRRGYEESLAELERKTKFFSEGHKYVGDFLEFVGGDWLAEGVGEFQFDTGEVAYEGEWRSGLRQGQGTATFEEGQWRGSFWKDEAKGVFVSNNREALYHGEALRAFVDELVPGKRLRVHRRSAEDGTIVGRFKKAIFYVHFDARGRREIVDLAQTSFELLQHQSYFHRIESTQLNDMDATLVDPTLPEKQHLTFFYAENIFRPPEEKQNVNDKDTDDDELAELEAAAQKRWLEKTATNKEKEAAALARAKLDDALSSAQSQSDDADKASQDDLHARIQANRAKNNKKVPRHNNNNNTVS